MCSSDLLLVCTHFTSYSLLSFVHGIVCESSLAIQDYVFYGVWCKICLRVGKNCAFDYWKSCFWSSGLKTNVFEKILNSFSCISFMKLFGLSVFCINFCSFSKKFRFPEFWSIECVSWPIEIPLIFNHDFLLGSIDIRSMLEQSKLGNFQFLSFWPNFFFSLIVYMHFLFLCLFYFLF